MDSFEHLIGKNINDVSLNESSAFFTAPLQYSYRNCGKRYPSSKHRLCEIDYYNIISFEELFKKEAILIIWYTCDGTITDLELYYLSNDFEVLRDDYERIVQSVLNGEAHLIREGDTTYLGASRINEKTTQPYNDKFADKREFVLKKRYLQKILNEMEIKCNAHSF